MKDNYQIDLEKYSIAKFKHSLESRTLIPSRVSLKDDLESRFDVVTRFKITNLKELVDRLKTKKRIEQFAAETGLSIRYLTLLRREAQSYVSKPVRLDKLLGVQTEYLEWLAETGIRHTKHLFLQTNDGDDRDRLEKETGIPAEALNELVGLSDLSRIYGVGPVFARMIYDVGITSVQAFASCSAAEFIRIYEEQTQKKADFGVGEIQFSIELAKILVKADE